MNSPCQFFGFLVLLTGILHPAILRAADPVDFEAQVGPVLSKKCLGCHTANIAKGDIVLSERGAALDPVAKLIVPGDALASEIYLAATPEAPGETPYMPEKGKPLTEAEADLLKRWIDEGAHWPDGLVLREASQASKDWWAYRPLTLPEHDSIDAFIDARLAESDLEQNPPADARTFLRRATYDLTGLPPTPDEVTAFESAFAADPDGSVDALIDRLLASPRYGERWGRHWLDVVRFGESNGYERNVIIPDLWPFRDYIIHSLNEDKPFDQLIREHIAGDVFGRGNPEVEIGSAFLVAGPYDNVGNQDPVQAAQIRANTMDEIINATGEAFLGMTLGCARCHDHKFDPITQEDYYALYATFAGVRHGSVPWASPEEKAKRSARLTPLTGQQSALETERKTIETATLRRGYANLDRHAAGWLRPPVDRTGTEDRFPPVTAKFVRLLCDGQDINPTARTFRLDEFEVWSAEPTPRNVALAANGAVASGASRQIEDFPGAYGPQLTIDGKFGARFISAGSELVIELAEPTEIDRVFFSSARGEETPEHRKFTFVSEYRIEVSTDGKSWTEVASGKDRKPPGLAQASSDRPPSVARTPLDHRLLRRERTEAESQRLAAIASDLARLKREIAAIPPHPTAWIGKRVAADAAGPFHLFIGGNSQKKGSPVSPASPSTLSEVLPGYELPMDSDEAQRRSELAHWMTSPENPLTLRVLANRLWHYHFGVGIVDTPNDFGYMGGRPTHPKLLDFLALQIRENGWRIKDLHRMIMSSRAYRQSSAHRLAAAEIDGDSRLLWRFPPRRLSAEEIRDTVLATAGQLDLTMGGPGFRLYRYLQDNVSTYEPLDQHGPETYRRAVYHQNARASVVDLMTDYDQPDCAFSAPKRAQTTTPLQALTMLNHAFTIDMADALARRIEGEVPEAGSQKKIREAYRMVLLREPSDEEIREAANLVESHGLRALSRALLNASELIYLD